MKAERGWRMAHWVKHLPHQHKDQSLVPRMRVKEMDAVVMACVLIPALERRRKVGPWGSKTSQANPLGDFQASKKTCLKKRKDGLCLSENSSDD